MRRLVVGLMGCAVLVAGCGEKPPAAQPTSPQFILKKPVEPPLPPPPPEKRAEPPYQRGGSLQLTPDPLGGPARVADTTQVPAQVGVGAPGQGLQDPKLVQMIVTPARALFSAQERLVFEVSVPHAVQLYEATQGRRIRSHAEFMEYVIRANQIQLPKLPEGQRYVFDSEAGELMVEKPATP